MERLTISGGEIAFYEPICAKCSNKNAPKIQKQIDKNIPFYDMVGYKYENMTIRKIKDIYKKLAELEDILAKYGIENAEELDNLINSIKTNTLIDIENKEILELKNANLKNELAELKQKAIVPKYNINQIVYLADKYYNKVYEFKIATIYAKKSKDEHFDLISYDGHLEENCYATREEAEQKLAETKGEKDV